MKKILALFVVSSFLSFGAIAEEKTGRDDNNVDCAKVAQGVKQEMKKQGSDDSANEKKGENGNAATAE